MRHRMMIFAATLAAMLTAVMLDAQVADVRSSAISGVIVGAGADHPPMANVLVDLTDRLTGEAVAAYTTRDGRFLFSNLSAGAYVISASKPAYVTARYGASATNRSGTAVVVTRGEHVRDVTMVLQRGAVITGVVYDANGTPSPRRAVTVLQRKSGRDGVVWTPMLGDSALITNDGGGPMTDDHGVYRIYGLSPGEYRVAVGLGRPLPFTQHRTTIADLDRARQLIASPPPAATAANGLPNLNTLPLTDMFGSIARPRGEVIAYAPVYYPASPSAAGATTITLGFGEERGDIDVHLTWTRTASIDGAVIGKVEAPGGPAQSLLVQVVSKDPGSGQKWGTGVPQTSDQFNVAGLPPGEFVVEALLAAFGAKGGAVAAPAMFGWGDVVISGADVSNVTLPLRPGVSVSGRITVDGAIAIGSAHITMTPEGVSRASLLAQRTETVSNGALRIANLAPARYRMSAEAATLNGRPVGLESISISGADVTHRVIDLSDPSMRGDVEVRFSSKLTELKGTVQDASGALPPGYSIVVFPVDRGAWYWHSPAIQIQKLSSVADFDLRKLPAGEYFLAALSDLAADQEFDPVFLEEVSAAAVRVKLVAGVTTIQNLRVGGLTRPSAIRPGQSGPRAERERNWQ